MSWFEFSLNDFSVSFLSILLEGVPFMFIGTLLSGLVARELALVEKQSSAYFVGRTPLSRVENCIFYNGPVSGVRGRGGAVPLPVPMRPANSRTTRPHKHPPTPRSAQ